MPEITRFAPSPTGLLHLGHAHAALFAHQAAMESGGTFLLRLEDIDPIRCREDFIDQIYQDLSWLGLDWPRPVRRQSQHLADYQQALDKLRDMGLLYPCLCTRKEIEAEIARSGHAPHGPDGVLYPGTCRHRRIHPGDDPCAWRLDMEKAIQRAGPLRWHDRRHGWLQADPGQFGDVVLARKDTPTSYHLAVTVDDALQEVSLVTRGEDLLAATHVHRLLQALLDLPSPDYHHHRLLTDDQGRRYAKRDKSLTLQSLRQSGHDPEQIRALSQINAAVSPL